MLVIDPRTMILKRAGLFLRVVNNGTTGTPSWSGYNLLRYDPLGEWSIETSSDNISFSEEADEAATESTSAALPLGNPGTAKYFRVKALSGVVASATSGPTNAPVTGLSILSANDDGSGTSFDLEYDCTEPVGYTSTYVRVRVLVESDEVYNEEFAFNDASIAIISGLPGLPGDDVDIEVTVLGRTGVSGAESATATDSDLVTSGDADATAWITDIETAKGSAISGADSTAINDCVVGLKAVTGNYWDDIYSMGLFWFANAAANSVRAKIGGNITFPGGHVTHGANYLTFTSPGFPDFGYANLGFTPTDAGMSNTSLGIGCARAGDMSNASASDMGNTAGGTTELTLNISQGGTNTLTPGNTFSCQVSGGTTGIAGLYMGNRNGAEVQLIAQSSGGQEVLGSRSDASGGNIYNAEIYLGGLNGSGSLINFTLRSYMFWIAQSNGVSQSKLEDAMVYIYAMLATRGL